MSGLFIAFEGIDGSGKSTQIARLVEHVEARGITPLLVREPGGTELGERIRDLLLDEATGDISGEAEALLYAASRAELVSRKIAPALKSGRLIIADRFVGSSIAYQGAGRGLGSELVRNANALAIAGHMPDITVLLRLDTESSARRLAAIGAPVDRIEAAGAGFFGRVVDAYDQLAEAESWHVIDASRGIEEVAGELLDQLREPLQQLAAADLKGARA